MRRAASDAWSLRSGGSALAATPSSAHRHDGGGAVDDLSGGQTVGRCEEVGDSATPTWASDHAHGHDPSPLGLPSAELGCYRARVDRPVTITALQPEGNPDAIIGAVATGVILLGLVGLASIAEGIVLAWLVVAMIAVVAVAVKLGRGRRVELRGDQIIDRRMLGWGTFPLDDVVGVKVREVPARWLVGGDPAVHYRGEEAPYEYFDESFKGYFLDQVTLRFKSDQDLEFAGRRASIQAWLTALVDALVPRMTRRMERGETLSFIDPGRGGIAVSARGVRPHGVEPTPGAEIGGYRVPHRDGGAWIPWGDIASTELDAQGLTIRRSSGAAGLSLSQYVDSLPLLDRLLTTWIERERATSEAAAHPARDAGRTTPGRRGKPRRAGR